MYSLKDSKVPWLSGRKRGDISRNTAVNSLEMRMLMTELDPHSAYQIDWNLTICIQRLAMLKSTIKDDRVQIEEEEHNVMLRYRKVTEK